MSSAASPTTAAGLRVLARGRSGLERTHAQRLRHEPALRQHPDRRRRPPSEFEPLNRTSNPFFSPANSGYGANAFYKNSGGGTEMPYGYGPKFKVRNMSDWLPLIKG